MTLQEIKEKIDAGLDADKAVELLTAYLEENPRDDEALTMRGLKHWSLGDRAAAINDYLAAIEINPNSKAVEAKNATYDILNYYNKDLYNP